MALSGHASTLKQIQDGLYTKEDIMFRSRDMSYLLQDGSQFVRLIRRAFRTRLPMNRRPWRLEVCNAAGGLGAIGLQRIPSRCMGKISAN